MKIQTGDEEEAPYQSEDDHLDQQAATHTLLLARAAYADEDDVECSGDCQETDCQSTHGDANANRAGCPILAPPDSSYASAAPQAWGAGANSLAAQLQEAERARYPAFTCAKAHAACRRPCE